MHLKKAAIALPGLDNIRVAPHRLLTKNHNAPVEKTKFVETIFMAAQLLDNEFEKCWSMLTIGEKESLLAVAKNYVQLKKEAGEINIEQYNKEIDDAVTRVENGEFYSHEEVMKMSKGW